MITNSPLPPDYKFKTRLELLNYAVDFIGALFAQEGIPFPPDALENLKFTPDQVYEDLTDDKRYYTMSVYAEDAETKVVTEEKIAIIFGETALPFEPLLVLCLYDDKGIFTTKEDIDTRARTINRDAYRSPPSIEEALAQEVNGANLTTPLDDSVTDITKAPTFH